MVSTQFTGRSLAGDADREFLGSHWWRESGDLLLDRDFPLQVVTIVPTGCCGEAPPQLSYGLGCGAGFR